MPLRLRRRRQQERREGVVRLLPRRGEAAAAAEAHDGVQIPVVEVAVLLHWRRTDGRGVVGFLALEGWRRRGRRRRR
jgi:hypothetical protein